MENELQKVAEMDALRKLLAGVRREEDGAFERLADQYSSLTEGVVRRFAPSFGISGDSGMSETVYDLDDLRQYAAMALYRAAVTYSPDDKGREVSFGLYAKVCIQNAMITELRKYRREQKKRAVREESEDGRRKRRFREWKTTEDPLWQIVSDEGMRGTLEKFRSALSGYEQEVFEYYIVGKSVTEIAERLGKDEKSVSNAIYRMKVKIRGLLKT